MRTEFIAYSHPQFTEHPVEMTNLYGLTAGISLLSRLWVISYAKAYNVQVFQLFIEYTSQGMKVTRALRLI